MLQNAWNWVIILVVVAIFLGGYSVWLTWGTPVLSPGQKYRITETTVQEKIVPKDEGMTEKAKPEGLEEKPIVAQKKSQP
jgi:hypothetical protein